MSMDEIIPVFGTEPHLNLFFESKQLEKLTAAEHNINRAFKDIVFFRTPTLLRLSVLNDLDHPTLESKYWQLVNEMYAHSTGLADLIFDIELKQVEIDELESKFQTGDGFQKRRDEIELRRARFALVNMQKTANARIEEIHNQNTAMEDIKTELQKQGVDIEKQTINDHQLRTFAVAWTNEVCNITEHTDVNDRKNITARWVTCMNILRSCGELEGFINSLEPKQREKLRQLKLIDGGKK